MSVVTDPDPTGKISAWRTYRACLETALTLSTSHAVVLQDDTVCQPGFLEAATAAVNTKPGVLISFFHGPQPPNAHRPIRNAVTAGNPFWQLPRGRWVPVVALCWPTPLITMFLHWADHVKQVKPDFAGDDAIVGQWASKDRVEAWVTAPSLVEHPDDQQSLFGRKQRGRRTAVAIAADCADWTRLLPPSAASCATFASTPDVS